MTETIDEGVSYRLCRHGSLIFHHKFLVAQLFKPGVFEGLTGCHAVVGVVDEHFLNEILDIFGGVWNQLENARATRCREVKFHVGSILLKLLKQVILGCSANVMDLVNLIKFIISREEREKRNYFEKDTSHAPHIHLVTVITVS